MDGDPGQLRAPGDGIVRFAAGKGDPPSTIANNNQQPHAQWTVLLVLPRLKKNIHLIPWSCIWHSGLSLLCCLVAVPQLGHCLDSFMFSCVETNVSRVGVGREGAITNPHSWKSTVLTIVICCHNTMSQCFRPTSSLGLTVRSNQPFRNHSETYTLSP